MGCGAGGRVASARCVGSAVEDHPFERVVAALQARSGTVRYRDSDRVRATCPAHPDSKPSLSVTRKAEGVVLHCHGGCPQGVPARALGFQAWELFTGPPATKAPRRIVATYDYARIDGMVIAQKVRFEPKGFSWRRLDPTARSGYRSGLDGPSPGLYQWPALVGASRVYIVEGEKGADLLTSLGLVATCGSSGASTWKDHWSKDLLEAISAGCEIVILADNDHVGRQHAARIAADLFERRADQAGVVKVVSLPGLLPGGDVVDWLAAGQSMRDLVEVVDAAPVWSPGAAEHRRLARRAERQRERRRRRRGDQPPVEPAEEPVDALQAALGAVLDHLRADPARRSGRQLKTALKGIHGRDFVDLALRLGLECGALVCEPGPRNAKHYRPGAKEIRGLQSDGHSDASVRAQVAPTASPEGGFASGMAVSDCPEARSPEASVNSFLSLQETDLSNRPASESGHSPLIQTVEEPGQSPIKLEHPQAGSKGFGGLRRSRGATPDAAVVDERERDVAQGGCRSHEDANRAASANDRRSALPSRASASGPHRQPLLFEWSQYG